MTLPLPNLDDTPYEVLTTGALKALPKRAPEWTEYNASDPGVTVVELLAALAEQQMYYVNRLRPAYTVQFLKLLGTAPRPARPTRLRITVDPDAAPEEPLPAPKHTRFRAGTRFFESEESCRLPAPKVTALFRQTPNGYLNCLNLADILPFGRMGQVDQIFYIGFDRPPEGPLHLDLDLASGPAPEDEPAFTWRAAHDALLLWEAATADGWQIVAPLEDTTRQLSWSGRIRFPAVNDLQKRTVLPIREPFYYLRVSLVRAGFDQTPVITGLGLNEWYLEERETLIACREFKGAGPIGPALRSDWTWRFVSRRDAGGVWYDQEHGTYMLDEDDDGNLTFIPEEGFSGETSYRLIAAPGLQHPIGQGSGQAGQTMQLVSADATDARQVTSRLEGRRFDWRPVTDFSNSKPDDRHYVMGPGGRITFGDGMRGQEPAEGEEFIQVNRDDAYFHLGVGTGIANQEFYLADRGVSELQLQSRLGEEGWADWHRVTAFYGSGPRDRHFVLDPDEPSLRFGNGLRGRVPRVGEELRLVSLVTSRSIVEPPRETLLLEHPETYRAPIPVLITRTEEGVPEEQPADAVSRVQRDLEKVNRAVTLTDHAALALATPGIHLAAAHAFITLEDGWEGKREIVNVAVLPFSAYPERTPRPIPGRRLLDLVEEQMQRSRLLTVRMRVVPPVYLAFGVRLTVVTGPQTAPERIRKAVSETLSASYTAPVDRRQDDPRATPFGKPVTRAHIHRLVTAIDGVLGAFDIQLRVQAAGGNSPLQDGDLFPAQDTIAWCDATRPDIQFRVKRNGGAQ
ncbi:MAG: hypothetical protein QNK37_01620 [Acidobacteriota bacterium]|nr:hypothetical protein [Acidobacteriota bacterium]